MGGIFGGGGSSSSNSTTVNETNIATEVNIDFDLDTLAQAIADGNQDQAKIELLKAKLQAEEINAQNKSILAQQQETEVIRNFTDKLSSYFPILLIGGGYYLYMKGKKKK